MSACRVLRHRPAPARASSQQWLTASPMDERLQSIVLFRSQNQRLFGSPSSHRSLLQSLDASKET